MRSTSSSAWPPRACSSQVVSSSSASAGAPEDEGRLACFRMVAKRSLKRRAYSVSLVGCSVTSGGMVVGCETGISCLRARDEYKSSRGHFDIQGRGEQLKRKEHSLRRLSTNALQCLPLPAQLLRIGLGHIMRAAGGAVVGLVRVVEQV